MTRNSKGWNPVLILVFLLSIALAAGQHLHASPPLPQTELQGRILRWIDGDTTSVLITTSGPLVPERIRLIGIDAPETSGGKRAAEQGERLGKDANTILVLGRKAKEAAERIAPPGTAVRVELDVQRRDRYGRLLAYIYLPDGRMINEELVRQGWAMVYTVPPNVRYAERFTRAQREAREKQRGLWGYGSSRPVGHPAGGEVVTAGNMWVLPS